MDNKPLQDPNPDEALLVRYCFPLLHMIKIPLEISTDSTVSVEAFYKVADVESRLAAQKEELAQERKARILAMDAVVNLKERIKELSDRNLELASELTWEPMVKKTMEIHMEWQSNRIEELENKKDPT